MNYRIYQNITGWEYVTTVVEKELNNAISSFKDEIYLLIIKHDIKLDQDETYYNGYAGDYEVKVKKKNNDKQWKKIRK